MVFLLPGICEVHLMHVVERLEKFLFESDLPSYLDRPNICPTTTWYWRLLACVVVPVEVLLKGALLYMIMVARLAAVFGVLVTLPFIWVVKGRI